jgi:hypothetical protein
MRAENTNVMHKARIYPQKALNRRMQREQHAIDEGIDMPEPQHRQKRKNQIGK